LSRADQIGTFVSISQPIQVIDCAMPGVTASANGH
jgi:hypothetical protein